MNGDKVDEGGCVNTLTHVQTYAAGQGQRHAHSMIVQIAKA